MSHEAMVSRAHPGLIQSIIDDSGSMAAALPGTSDAVCAWTERLTGIVLKELLARCTDMKGESVVVKPRYYLHMIQYGSTPQTWTQEEVDIETASLKYSEAGNSFGLAGRLGGTDADAAFQVAHQFLQGAVAKERFQDSFPPMVFHLTDGASATDARSTASQIKALSTSDGNVLVVNAYIGTQTSLGYSGPEDFPGYMTADEAGPSEDNIRLFDMSSEAPESIRANLIEDGIFPNFRQGARLFFDVRTKDMLKHAIRVVSSMPSHAARTQE